MRPVARSLVALAAVVGLAVAPDQAALAERQAPGPAISGRPAVGGREARVPAPAAAPTFRVQTIARGLDHAWDLAFTPNGSILITERNRGRIMIRRPGGALRTFVSNVPGLWVSGETGLMSIAVDPKFRSNRRFYICHGFINSSGHDVRVTAWRAKSSLTSARQVQVLVRGIFSTSGRHGGCRLRIGSGGGLFIGTGDAATTGTARSLRSLAGKVLRVNRLTGRAVRGNPFINADHPNARKIWTYGHRNVQGLAERPGGRMWSVEHGTFRDDEVNRLIRRGDYGWQAGPGYDESPPMTDFSLPGPQIGARWSSGSPTVATSGAIWLSHPRWGSWRGALAVAALKDESVRIMRFNSGGTLTGIARPAALASDFGRLRSAQLGPGGALFLTTDNGGGADRVLAVMPNT